LTGTAVEKRLATAICRDCGVVLTDAFDRALGICERCRTDNDQAEKLGPAENTEPGLPPLSGLDYPDGRPGSSLEFTDADLDAVADRFEDSASNSGEAYDAAEISDGAPLEETPEPSARDLPAAIRNFNHLMNAAVFSPARWRAGTLFVAFGVIAALGAAGMVFLIHRRAPKSVKQAEAVRLVAPLESARQRWSREFIDLKGDALQWLKQGDVDLATDTPSAYQEAEKCFEKAFLLQATGDQPIAGYLLAVAWGRGASLDDSAVEELIKMAEAAKVQWGRSPRVLIAYASLLLLRPDSPGGAERARAFAQEAVGLASGREKALAHLVLSSAYLSSSAELAIQNIELALKLDPGLRRGYLQRAMAQESLGDYRSAISDLEKRLALNADQWEARAMLARIYQEVGEPGLAYGLYDASGPGGADPRGAIARAVIQYQAEQRPQVAAAALREWVETHEDADRALTDDAWVHRAAAERLAGRLDSAANAADQALKISPSDPAPRLQLFLVALSRGSTEEAERQFSALKRRLANPSFEKLLEGRLLLAEHRDMEAMRTFADAAQLDPRRIDALLLAGAAAASAGRRDETLRYLVSAGQMDPTRAAPTALATRSYVQPDENLAGAEGRVIRLAKGSTDVTPRLYEALIRFHQRDGSAADKLLEQVLDVDTGNALAYALRALIALQKGSLRAARSSAERAVAVGRGVALAHYAYGAVLARTGKIDAAQAEFRQAEALAPTLLAAQVSLAELDAKKKSVDAARTRLVHVLRVDPSYLAAKRALYSLER
jgi:tetratricopeptide (TPR) repeat protein